MSLRMDGNLSHMRNRGSHLSIRECHFLRTSNDCRRSPCTPSSQERRMLDLQGHLSSTLRNYQQVRRVSARRDSRLPDLVTMSRLHRPIRRCRDYGFKVWLISQEHQQPSHLQCSLKLSVPDHVVRLSDLRCRCPWRRDPVHEHPWAVPQRHPADDSARR